MSDARIRLDLSFLRTDELVAELDRRYPAPRWGVLAAAHVRVNHHCPRCEGRWHAWTWTVDGGRNVRVRECLHCGAVVNELEDA